jgi:2-polyprenyl-6-methoxyphenol hydroxylase-like FAD-dependent oxidoreductase
MGIEDGMVFARACAAATSPAEALSRYVGARRERANWVLQKSRETGQIYHSGKVVEREPAKHVSAESLGLMAYDPVRVAV